MNGYQAAYFRFMTQTRETVLYMSEYIDSSGKWNTRINMLMAIASSSSIGAWVIWRELSWMWAAIIAASQVVGAVKVYLPFRRRLSVLPPLRDKLERLCIEMEKGWYAIANGELTEREINERTMDFETRKLGIEQEHLHNVVLPERRRFLIKAREMNKVYWENRIAGETNVWETERAQARSGQDR